MPVLLENKHIVMIIYAISDNTKDTGRIVYDSKVQNFEKLWINWWLKLLQEFKKTQIVKIIIYRERLIDWLLPCGAEVSASKHTLNNPNVVRTFYVLIFL